MRTNTPLRRPDAAIVASTMPGGGGGVAQGPLVKDEALSRMKARNETIQGTDTDGNDIMALHWRETLVTVVGANMCRSKNPVIGST